jgi:hypothetical protein
MPLPFLVIAIPVLHSSGAWIASTGAAGYIAGTLSSTWIGAFVLGNGTLLSSLGSGLITKRSRLRRERWQKERPWGFDHSAWPRASSPLIVRT